MPGLGTLKGLPQATGGQALRREVGSGRGWRGLAACNWSGHQTCLSVVNLPAPIPAPVDKPGHGRPVSGLRVPGFTGLQRPKFPPHQGITFMSTGTQKS